MNREPDTTVRRQVMLQGKLPNSSRPLQIVDHGGSILQGLYAANHLAISIAQGSDTDLHRYPLFVLPLSVHESSLQPSIPALGSFQRLLPIAFLPLVDRWSSGIDPANEVS